jgi:hypothetical protein
MTSNISPSSNKNKDLINRLIILEKFIELKSNECAYYRTKVHLMQMSSFNSQITNKSLIKNNKRSSSEDSITSQSQSNSIDKRHRRNSIPLFSPGKSNLKKTRKRSNSSIPQKSKHLSFSSSTRRHRKKIYAHNQNYYEEILPHSKQKSTNDKNLIEQILISYINKHHQQS